jgi:hypothetical protein
MQDAELSEIILTEAARCARGRLDSEASARLIRFLNDASGRNHVYRCCLDLAQDPGRRQRIMMLLRNYVCSFPPSLACLAAVEEFCHLHSTADVSQELLKLTATLLREAPLEGLVTKMPRSTRFGYASEFALLPDIPSTAAAPSPGSWPHHHANNSINNINRNSNRHVPITPVLETKWMDVAVRKNESQKCYSEAVYRRVWCPPYSVQFPLLCLESTVEQQLKFMSSFSANYKTNRNVAQATLFFIKQLCDSYVSKLPLQDAAQHFRTVTICYVPMLLDMMESDYLCVRNHVYDFILNLGVHIQLVDPAGVYPGCTEALEHELLWLLLTVTSRQAVLKASDETTWTAAAKCILAVMPTCYQHLLDCRVLFQILQLPGLWEVYPEAFGSFAMAFARSLLTNKEVDAPVTANVFIDEVELAKLGNFAVPAMFTVYRHSTTPGARKALFQLLLAYAARRHGLLSAKASGGSVRIAGQILSSEARAGALRDLLSVDFFWYVEPLLFYMSENVQRELPRRIADGLVKSDFDGTTKSWSVVLPLADQVLGILADDAELSSSTQARFKAIEDLRKKDEAAFVAALQDLLNEVSETIPQLLEVQTDLSDCRTHSAAWRLAFVSLRWSARYLAEDKHRALTEKLTRALVDYKDERGRTRNRPRMGHICTYLLCALGTLCRTSARRDVVTFRTVLEVLLFDREDAIDVRTALALYTRMMEYVCEPAKQGRYELHSARDGSDISVMVLREKCLRIPTGAAQLVSVRVLWGLYRSLALSQEAYVCRARHVLVLMLAHYCTERSGVEVRTWKTVLADPYPPVSLLAAEKILYLSRTEEKPAVAAAAAAEASADANRDIYHEATRMLEKGLAGKRGKPPMAFGLLHDDNYRDGERGERPSVKAMREMALS